MLAENILKICVNRFKKKMGASKSKDAEFKKPKEFKFGMKMPKANGTSSGDDAKADAADPNIDNNDDNPKDKDAKGKKPKDFSFGMKMPKATGTSSGDDAKADAAYPNIDNNDDNPKDKDAKGKKPKEFSFGMKM